MSDGEVTAARKIAARMMCARDDGGGTRRAGSGPPPLTTKPLAPHSLLLSRNLVDTGVTREQAAGRDRWAAEGAGDRGQGRADAAAVVEAQGLAQRRSRTGSVREVAIASQQRGSVPLLRETRQAGDPMIRTLNMPPRTASTTL